MRRRLLGWALVLYGVIGLALVLGAGVAGLDAAGRLERLASSASGTLGAASRSVDAAAAAFTNVDASLDESQASAASAAELARDASVTLGSLGRAMRLSVFGAQPLLPLADDFADSAAQASALADTLDNVATSIDATSADMTAIGDQFDQLATELGALRDAGGTADDPPPVRLIVLVLVAWLLVPALGGIVGGIALVRLAATPAAAP